MEVATAVEVPVTGPVVAGTETPEVTDPEAVPVGPTDAVLETSVDPPTGPVDVPTVVAPVPEGVPEGEPEPDVETVVLPVLVDPPLGGTAVEEDGTTT